MSLDVRIQLSDMVSEELQRLAAALAPDQRQNMLFLMGQDAKRAIQLHIEQEYVPNQKTGIEFWQQAIASMEVEATPEAAEVSFEKVGVRLRYYGSGGLPDGGVTPGKSLAGSGPNKGKPTKTLSVPTDDVPTAAGAYVRPGQAGLLAFIAKAKGGETVGFLISGREKIATRGPNKGKPIVVGIPKDEGGKLLYVLRTITRHKGDPNIIVSDEILSDVLVEAASRFIFPDEDS